MDKADRPLKDKLPFLALLVLLFAGMLFLAFDSAHMTQNSIMLCGCLIVLLVTYYLSLSKGLATAVAVLLLLAVYTLIDCTLTGAPIQGYVFFWMAWLPLLTVALHLFVQRTVELRNQNVELTTRLYFAAMTDNKTGLKNMRFFDHDAHRYLGISANYSVELYLVLFQLQNETSNIEALGDSKFAELIAFISKSISATVGETGDVYLLDESPHIWGILLLGDESFSQQTVEVVQQAVTITRSYKRVWRVFRKLDQPLMINVVYRYNGERLSPFAFLNKAKSELSDGYRSIKPTI